MSYSLPVKKKFMQVPRTTYLKLQFVSTCVGLKDVELIERFCDEYLKSNLDRKEVYDKLTRNKMIAEHQDKLAEVAFGKESVDGKAIEDHSFNKQLKELGILK